MVSKLTVKDNIKTKPLYTQVFNEDTKEFIDYYYSEIGSSNAIYTIEDKAMLHLNPFEMSIYGEKWCVNYIVAVATREECRKKGLMRKLMIRAMQDMYGEGQPFAYLMPAAEAIYEPYDFKVVGTQHYYALEDKSCDLESITPDGISIRKATTEDCVDLANFTNEIMSNQSSIYTLRTVEYFTRILKEQHVQNGGVKMYLKNNEIQAVASYSEEGELKLRDVIKKNHISLPFVPIGHQNMMARVINVKTFLGLIPVDILRDKGLAEFNLEDGFIPTQTGNYQLNSDGGVKFIKEFKPGNIYTVGELTELIFKNTSVVFNEIV